jgi:hypothetical protein
MLASAGPPYLCTICGRRIVFALSMQGILSIVIHSSGRLWGVDVVMEHRHGRALALVLHFELHTSTKCSNKAKSFKLATIVPAKPQANKCPLKPKTKPAPPRTSKQARRFFPSPSSISIPVHPLHSTPSSYPFSCVCPGAAAKLRTAPPSLQGATEKWSDQVRARREPSVVRNRRERRWPDPDVPERTGGASLGLRDRSRPAGGWQPTTPDAASLLLAHGSS